MENIDARMERAVEEITGNEALLQMLETDAAAEMLAWGKSLVTSVVMRTQGLDDTAADAAMLPRLKAVRQFMRSVGNWAAGKYVDPASRIPLRDNLLESMRLLVERRHSFPLPMNWTPCWVRWMTNRIPHIH